MPVDCTCRHCGRHFTRRPFELRAGRGSYCGTGCKAQAQRSDILFACEACGVPFHRSPAQAANGAGRFCSRRCKHSEGHGTRPVLDRWRERIKRSPEEDGCWEWTETGRNGAGYGLLVVGSRSDGSRRNAPAHRLSWELHYGPIPAGMFVCHRCDNPPCVRPDHLFLGTPAENTRDMVAKDRHRQGARHPTARLTEAAVRDIRQRAEAGVPRAVLATEYGIHREYIALVINRRRWKHVE